MSSLVGHKFHFLHVIHIPSDSFFLGHTYSLTHSYLHPVEHLIHVIMAPNSRIILTRHAQAEHNVGLDYSSKLLTSSYYSPPSPTLIDAQLQPQSTTHLLRRWARNKQRHSLHKSKLSPKKSTSSPPALSSAPCKPPNSAGRPQSRA